MQIASIEGWFGLERALGPLEIRCFLANTTFCRWHVASLKFRMNDKSDEGKDPVEGAAQMHPKGQTAGGAVGAVAGGAIGTVLGPIGTIVGAGLGAAFGAVVGGGISEGITNDPDSAPWLAEFQKEPFANEGNSLRDLAPAFRLGWLAYSGLVPFEGSLNLLEAGWDARKGDSTCSWETVVPVARAGWDAHARATA